MRVGTDRIPGHQFHRPATCMNAGTITIRMSVASSSTATARLKPSIWAAKTRENAKVPKTITMIAAALVITEAVAVSPSIVA